MRNPTMAVSDCFASRRRSVVRCLLTGRLARGVWTALFVAVCLIAAHAQGTWVTETSLPSAIQEVSVTALNNQVYTVGGSVNQVRSNALQVFNPSTHVWSTAASYPGTALDHIGVAVWNGVLYKIGGLSAWPSPAVATVQSYNPSTNTWTALASLPVARGAAGAAAINGKIYVAGGLESGVPVADFTVYDIASNTWTTLPNMPTARDHVSAAALNGKFYAIGGHTTPVCGVTTVEIYDPSTNTWSAGTPMHNGRAIPALGLVNGHIQAFGGDGNAVNCGVTAAAEDFDPVANTWTQLPDMPTPRHGTGGATITSSVYIPAGATASGDAATAVNERFDYTAQTLPAGWADQDIGAVGLVGGASFFNGVFTVEGAGADIWGTADAFNFVAQPLNGDGQIVARVVSMRLQNANAFAKAGVMIRATLAASSTEVILDVKPGGGLEFMSRASTGAATSFLASGTGSAPVWLKLVRSGTTITGFSSPDGVTWTTVGATSVTMAAGVSIGLAVCSHNTGYINTSTFDNVTITAGGGGGGGVLPTPWVDNDIGAVGLAGNASFASGTFTVQGAGADIWGTADSFNFLDQTSAGDGQIVARVVSLQNTNTFAKAGVMFRETLGANAAEVILDVKPGGGLEFMSRSSTGVAVTFLASGTGSVPVWLKLVRTGNTFSAFSSLDGSTFTSLGSTTVTMLSSAFVGLAVCSHTTTALNTATFDNVTVSTGGTTDLPPSVSITSPTTGSTFTAPATIAIAATAADTDATPVASVAFFANNGTTNTLLGTDTTSPYTFSWTNVPAGSYTLTAVATDTANQATTSTGVSITVSTGGTGALPSPWVDQDVGSTGLAGSGAFSAGVFTVKGAGADIWGTSDSFNFVYQTLNGSGQITARVVTETNTSVNAKAGVQIRGSLNANDVEVTLDLTPANATAAGGGMEMLVRTASGGSTTFVQGEVATSPVWVKLVRNGNTITGYASTDGNGWTLVNSATIPGLPATVFVGLAVCSHNTSALNTSTFDNVSVSTTATVTNPTTFTPKALAAATASGTAVGIPNLLGPTVVKLGPDGRLYVSGVNGRIFILTLDQTKLMQAGQTAVTNVQEIDDIYNHPSLTCNVNNQPFNCQPSSTPGRQLTGMTFDPASTASNVILYVSNSNFSTTVTSMAIDTYSGTITRLTLQPGIGNTMNVVSDVDLVVGLPRSRESHATNGIRVGPDGWLYIAQGGNTNAGQPSSFFLNLPDYYLGAAVLRLNLGALPSNLPIDLHNATASMVSSFRGVFEIYATGYRNPYDLAWHSNGKLYINVNSPNLTQGLTPSASDGCGATPSIDVGTPSDYLRLVTAGSYGGHPNPARGECVWGDGTVYSPPIPAQSNFLKYIGNYVRGRGDSSDGITEYTSNAFNSGMLHNLISAAFDTNLHVKRVILTPDGNGVNAIFDLPINTLNEPLAVCVDTPGNIYVAEYGANRITLLIPSSPGQ
jgi:N-acetylneuraminic acid mutarotase/regulation of enolase protein 1 (concanavalin A-like superfamily)